MKSHSSNPKPHKQTNVKGPAERLELPRDLFEGLPILSLQGNRFLCIENHRGILVAGREKMVIAAKPFRIEITGKDLCIPRFTKDYLEITGIIGKISLLP